MKAEFVLRDDTQTNINDRVQPIIVEQCAANRLRIGDGKYTLANIEYKDDGRIILGFDSYVTGDWTEICLSG